MVLDLTRLLPGAAATASLAQFGAGVIKVEEPGRGDYARSMPPFLNGQGAVFTLLNRGKRSVALNLKTPRGAEALLRVAEGADVLIESFRPGVMERLGLGWEVLRARNPRLIYVALTGYGAGGARRFDAGHDVNYLALGGVLASMPAIPAVQIADLAGGAMQAVIGILLALAARARTGLGQMVDVAMLDGAAALLPIPLALHQAAGGAGALTGRFACYNIYGTRDGRRLAVGALEPKFWAILCDGLGVPELIPEQFAEGERREEIRRTVAERFLARDAADWTERFRGADACVTLVRTPAEAAQDPELRARGTFVNADGLDHIGAIPKLSETPGELGGRPPALGEHTREVLIAAGIPAAEVDELC